MSDSSLPFVQTQIVYYGTTVLLVLGNIGNALILLIFSRHHRNPCSMYLMAGAIMNSVSLSFNVSQYLYNSFYVDPTTSSLVYCKLRFYLANAWGQLARNYIVFACIDRYALTSGNVRVRAFSRPSVALWCIVIGVVLWHLFPIHVLILLSIMNGRCGAYGLYYIFYSIYNVTVVWLIPAVAMVTCSYMAYSNIKRLHMRVRPVENDRGHDDAHVNIHRRDRDLFRMVLIEVITYIVFMMLYPCITAEMSITNYTTTEKSRERLQIESFVYFISQFLLSMNNAMPFYIYLVASKAFRNDFKKLVSACWRRVRRRTEVVHVTRGETMRGAQTNI